MAPCYSKLQPFVRIVPYANDLVIIHLLFCRALSKGLVITWETGGENYPKLLEIKREPTNSSSLIPLRFPSNWAKPVLASWIDLVKRLTQAGELQAKTHPYVIEPRLSEVLGIRAVPNTFEH